MDCNCIVMRGGEYDEISPEPEGFPESQYSHSQLPLLANIFSYWLRELAIFSRIANLRTGVAASKIH